MRQFTWVCFVQFLFLGSDVFSQLPIYECLQATDNQSDGTVDRIVKTSVQYNTNGQLTQRIDSIDSNVDGIIDQLRSYTYEYDIDGNVIRKNYFNDSNNDGTTDQWTVTILAYINGLLSQETYESNGTYKFVKSNAYDTSLNLISTIYEIDYGANGSIDQLQYFNYQYDSLGNKIYALVQNDNNANGSIDYSESETFIYNALNQITDSEILTDFNNDGSINFSIRKNYAYNSNNELEEIDIKSYSGLFNNLRSESLTQYSYLSNQLDQIIIQEDENADGVFDYVEISAYSYDQEGVLEEVVMTMDFDNDGVTDYLEHITYCTFDYIPPVVTYCPPDIIISLDPDSCLAIIDYQLPIFSDNIDGDDLMGIMVSGDTIGSILSVGSILITYQYTDANGNGPVECSFTVTIIDDIAPALGPCPTDIVTCDSTYSILDLPSVTASDNCGIASIDTVYNPNSDFDPGTITIVMYEVSDASGNLSTCSFSVEILETIPGQIEVTPIPFGCTGIATINALPDNSTYLWSNGSLDQSTTADIPGIYQVSITESNGCSQIVTDTIFIDYEPISMLMSSYSLLAEDDIEFDESEAFGGLGVNGAGKKVELDQNSTLWGFTKSPVLEVKNGSLLNGNTVEPFYGNPGLDTLPFLLPDVPIHPVEDVEKKDIKPRRGVTIVIDGNNCLYDNTQNCSYFDDLVMSENSTLIIRNIPKIRFTKITTKKNCSVIFEQSTDVYVNKGVTLDDFNYIGPDPNVLIDMTINFYVEEDLQVDKGSEFVANAITGHDIHVKEASAIDRTIMTGIYISKKKIRSDKFVSWTANNDCGIPLASLFQQDITIANDITEEIQPPIQNEQQSQQPQVMKKEKNGRKNLINSNFNIYPNPASHNTIITLNTELGPGIVKLFHNSGILIKSIQFKYPDPIELPLEGLQSGMYFITVRTENHIETKQLTIISQK